MISWICQRRELLHHQFLLSFCPHFIFISGDLFSYHIIHWQNVVDNLMPHTTILFHTYLFIFLSINYFFQLDETVFLGKGKVTFVLKINAFIWLTLHSTSTWYIGPPDRPITNPYIKTKE